MKRKSKRTPAAKESEPKQASTKTGWKWPGLWGSFQWFLGGEPGRSFGTALLILCIGVVATTILSINGLVLSAALGKVKIKTALTLLRVLIGWPVVALNIFFASLGFVVHLFRKRRDLDALKEVSGVVERIYLARKGNASFLEGGSAGGTGNNAQSSNSTIPEHISSLLHGAMRKVGLSHSSGANVTLPGSDKPVKMPTLK